VGGPERLRFPAPIAPFCPFPTPSSFLLLFLWTCPPCIL